MKKEGLAPIVLDAGDLLFTSSVLADSNRESETFRASSILDDNMNYPFDAINVGKYELAGGLDLLQKLINKTKSNFISANLRDSNSGRLLFNPYKPAAKTLACSKYGFAEPSINLNSNLPGSGILIM